MKSLMSNKPSEKDNTNMIHQEQLHIYSKENSINEKVEDYESVT